MGARHLVVIGNGPAGKEAAAVLRDKEPESRITIISKDHEGQYRPNFLPDYISGRKSLEQLYATPFRFYQDQEIKLRLGQPVAVLDLEERRIILDHKEVIRFDGLVIAVGGRPRIPEPLLVFQDLMYTLKTVQDANSWIDRLASVDSVVIVGGDLTSFAITRALLQLGKRVGFVFSEEAFWPQRCNDQILRAAAAKLAARGVEVVPGRLKRIVRHSETRFEIMTDCRHLEAGLVGAFFGLVPDVRFLAGSGLQIERGILVDEYLNTGFEGVYAAGDCAQVYHPELRDYWVSIGYDNALRLGRIAASNLAGGREETTVPPESLFCDQGVRANTSWWLEF